MRRSGGNTVGWCLCLAAGSVLAAGQAAAADWTLVPTIGATETFTDNINLAPNGQKRMALITQVSPGVSLRGTGARLNVAVDSSVDFNYIALEEHGTDLDVNLTGTGNAEILEELLFLDASASVSQEALDDTRATSASTTNTRNLETVQSYLISPYFQHRLGAFADFEERYTALVSRSTSDTVSDSTDHTFELSVISGADFSQLLWTFSARAVNSIEAGDQNEQERRVDFGFEYAVISEISLLGSAGYENFDFGAGRESIEGVTWSAGVRLRPGTRLDISASYGQRFNSKVVDATVNYAITERTTFTGSIANTLDEPQGEFGRNTASIGVDEQGQFVDTRSGQPFNQNAGGLGVTNERRRTTSYNASISTIVGRNTFALSYARQKKEGLFSGVTDTSDNVGGNWQRQLNQRTELSTVASYENENFGNSRETDQYTAAASVSFRISENATASLSYSFRRRESTVATDEFTENTVSVSAQYRF